MDAFNLYFAGPKKNKERKVKTVILFQAALNDNFDITYKAKPFLRNLLQALQLT